MLLLIEQDMPHRKGSVRGRLRSHIGGGRDEGAGRG